LIYLDSNVFIYAALNSEKLGEKARSLMARVQKGDIKAITCSLTFDELVWSVKKYRTIDHAVRVGEAFLSMPSLAIKAVDVDVLSLALDLIRKYSLHPRDSIHASSAITCQAFEIVSTDVHFDRVKELKRVHLQP